MRDPTPCGSNPPGAQLPLSPPASPSPFSDSTSSRRRSSLADGLVESNDVAGNYLQTLGTIYAVLLAFVVIVVWQQFNDARSAVEREANEVLDIFRTASGFSEPARGELREQLQIYVSAVLDREWEAMARDENGVFEEVWSVLIASPMCFTAAILAERETSLYCEALTASTT
jgi:hypothetical protein